MIPGYEQYTPTTWVNGESIANERNLNHIEGGINALGEALSTLLTAINNGEIGGSGGDADTVDGYHASAFTKNISLPSGSNVLATAMTYPTGRYHIECTNSVAPENYGYVSTDNHFVYDIEIFSSDYIHVEAHDMRSRGNSFTTSLVNGTWTGWVRIGDGCDALSAMRLREHDYSMGTDLSAEIIKLPMGKYNIRCMNTIFAPLNSTNSATSNDFFYEVEVLNSVWIKVTAKDIWSNNTYERLLRDGVWSDWKNISDGGNAEKINGCKISVQSTQPTSPSTGDLWIW